MITAQSHQTSPLHPSLLEKYIWESVGSNQWEVGGGLGREAKMPAGRGVVQPGTGSQTWPRRSI